jgi:hypothetical protein
MFNAVWRKLDKHKLIALCPASFPAADGNERVGAAHHDLAEAVNAAGLCHRDRRNVNIVCPLDPLLCYLLYCEHTYICF